MIDRISWSFTHLLCTFTYNEIFLQWVYWSGSWYFNYHILLWMGKTLLEDLLITDFQYHWVPLADFLFQCQTSQFYFWNQRLGEVYQTISRWCFQIFFIFTPTWGNDPIWLIFFQRGWNHQLDPPFQKVAGFLSPKNIFGNNPPQMVPMGLNFLRFQGLAAWFTAKSTTLFQLTKSWHYASALEDFYSLSRW